MWPSFMNGIPESSMLCAQIPLAKGVPQYQDCRHLGAAASCAPTSCCPPPFLRQVLGLLTEALGTGASAPKRFVYAVLMQHPFQGIRVHPKAPASFLFDGHSFDFH